MSEGQFSLTFCPNLFTSVVTEGSQTMRHEIEVMLDIMEMLCVTSVTITIML